MFVWIVWKEIKDLSWWNVINKPGVWSGIQTPCVFLCLFNADFKDTLLQSAKPLACSCQKDLMKICLSHWKFVWKKDVLWNVVYMVLKGAFENIFQLQEPKIKSQISGASLAHSKYMSPTSLPLSISLPAVSEADGETNDWVLGSQSRIQTDSPACEENTCQNVRVPGH